MAAKLTKTSTPGIYRRHAKDCNREGRCDCSYVVVYDGKARTFATADEAREAKRLVERQAKLARAHAVGLHRDQARDECPQCERERVERNRAEPTLRAYALEWIARYQGRGRRGFREITRDQYRGDLLRYVLPYFEGRTIAQLTPRDVANFIGWLCDERAQGERAARERRAELERAGRHGDAERVAAKPVTLADATVRRILAPLRSCLGTAMQEGLIRANPTAGASLPSRDAVRAAAVGEDDEPERRALTRSELATLLAIAPELYRPLFLLLASTGLRISEALALRLRDVRLDGSYPVVRVRRAYVKGRYLPPKSKYGRRDVPIDHALVLVLRKARKASEWPGDDDLVFCARDGRPLHGRNLSTRVLKPAAEEAGAPWAGWHTFRHTCASLLFDEGRNAVQVQRWLGHHSAAFTISTYVHLLASDLGEPLNPLRVKKRSSEGPETPANPEWGDSVETRDLQG